MLGLPRGDGAAEGEDIDELQSDLTNQTHAIRDAIRKVESRIEELREKKDELRSQEEDLLADVHEQEIGNLLVLRESLNLVSLGLTAVSDRIDTVNTLNQAFEGIEPLAQELEPILPHLQLVPGEMGSLLKELTDTQREVTSLLQAPEADLEVPWASPAAREVFEEAESRQDYSFQLPPPPTDLPHGSEPLAADGGETVETKPAPPNGIEIRVLEYVRDHDGRLDLTQCAEELGASTKRIIDVAYQLADEGKLRLG